MGRTTYAKSSSIVIAVAGSINIDLSFRTPHNPSPGETLTANSHSVSVGGKGANQAAACARLSRCQPFPSQYHGSDHHRIKTKHKSSFSSYSTHNYDNVNRQSAQISMVGAVGDDTYGKDAIKVLTRNSIDTSCIWRAKSETTGTAVILVDEETGENRIVLNPGANRVWSFGQCCLPSSVDVAIFQLEIPLQAVYVNLKNVPARGGKTILNPAPAKSLPRDVYQYVNHLIMNESEACILSRRPIAELSSDDCETLCQTFIEWGVQNVVITLGARGAAYMSPKANFQTLTAHKVANVQDTTGAGDTFVGAYAVMVAHMVDSKGTFDLSMAVKFAMCAAALSVSRQGAMDSIPWAEEVAFFARSEGLSDECWNWNQCLKEVYIPESDNDERDDEHDEHDDDDAAADGNENGDGADGDNNKGDGDAKRMKKKDRPSITANVRTSRLFKWLA